VLALGVKTVELRGFDYSKPVLKDGSDPDTKMKKLSWAKRIIEFYGDRVR
jgi:uncharacterized Rossmann fold enzyme